MFQSSVVICLVCFSFLWLRSVLAVPFADPSLADNSTDAAQSTSSSRPGRVFRLDWFDDIWDYTAQSFGFDDGDDDHPTRRHHHQSKRRCQHCKCGQANARNARLLGGTDLVPFEFPWLVQVQTFGLGAVPGTLINDRYVLTAASALKNLTPYDLKVVVGTHDACLPDVTSTIISVTDVRVHPDYAERTRQNDIALVRLSIAVRFSPFVSPICLPRTRVGLVDDGDEGDFDGDGDNDTRKSRKMPSSSSSTGGGGFFQQQQRRKQHVDFVADRVSIVSSWLKSTLAPNLTIADVSCLPRKVGLPILDVSACSESAARTQGCLGVVGAPSLLCRGDAGAGVMVRTTHRVRRCAKRGKCDWGGRRRRSGAAASGKVSYVLLGVLSDRQFCESRTATPGVAWEQLDSFHGLTLAMYTRVRAHLAWIVKNTEDAYECDA